MLPSHLPKRQCRRWREDCSPLIWSKQPPHHALSDAGSITSELKLEAGAHFSGSDIRLCRCRACIADLCKFSLLENTEPLKTAPIRPVASYHVPFRKLSSRYRSTIVIKNALRACPHSAAVEPAVASAPPPASDPARHGSPDDGRLYFTESNNIDIGNEGTISDNGVIRIGT
jgi:hypothetical protein